MKRKIPALIGAWLTLSVVYMIAGFSFGHLFANEAPTSEPLVLPIVGFAISNVLLVLFFSWVAEQMGHPVKAALWPFRSCFLSTWTMCWVVVEGSERAP